MANVSSIFPLLQAASAQAAATTKSGGSGSGTMGIIIQLAPFALLIVVFYFLVIRPQSKKQKETQKMLSGIKKGDKIITIGGVHGTVSSVKENSVIVKVDDNCKIEFLRSAVSTVVSREEASAEKTEKADKAESSPDVTEPDKK
jgi:preprotein translocase subunit YajC